MTERHPPRIANAPGLVWRPYKDGWEARWLPRTDLVKRGYPTKVQRVALVTDEPSDTERDLISDMCTRLQDDMLIWGRGGLPVVGTFDGTIRSLIYCYQTDPDSTYRKGRYRTRKFYDGQCKRIASTVWTDEDGDQHAIGDVPLGDIKARTILRWHEGWGAGGKVALSRSLIGMLRTLTGFGKTILEDADCARVSGLLSGMRFKMAQPRGERLTADQVVAIRAKAHAMGYPSIALAQAIQFELMLRQKDVIGEWVPIGEPGMSEIEHRGFKWLRGIRWSEIDDHLILRHTTSKRQKDIEVQLKLAPMVMEELGRLPYIPSSGPVVEVEGAPWDANDFRLKWRKIARAAGVPDNVFNMDSRAGGISEATDAGAELEHVRHAATHSDIGMTQRYSRGSVEKVANVMKMRVDHRNKPGTKDE